MSSSVGIIVPAYNGFVISPQTWGILRHAPHFTIVREGRTLGESRNIGIARLNTDYILPLDGDDSLHVEIIDAWQDALDDHPEIDVVYSNHHGNTDGHLIPCYAGEWTLEDMRRINVTSSCLMFRKSAWEKVGGYSDIAAYEDWEFIARLFRAGCKGMKVEGFGLIHTNHNNNKCYRDERDFGVAGIKKMLAERVPEVFSE